MAVTRATLERLAMALNQGGFSAFIAAVERLPAAPLGALLPAQQAAVQALLTGTNNPLSAHARAYLAGPLRKAKTAKADLAQALASPQLLPRSADLAARSRERERYPKSKSKRAPQTSLTRSR